MIYKSTSLAYLAILKLFPAKARVDGAASDRIPGQYNSNHAEWYSYKMLAREAAKK